MTANQHFVYTFGGYGDPPEPLKNYPIQPQFNPDHNSHHQWPRGWNGNTNRFNLKTYQWEYLKTGQLGTRTVGQKILKSPGKKTHELK